MKPTRSPKSPEGPKRPTAAPSPAARPLLPSKEVRPERPAPRRPVSAPQSPCRRLAEEALWNGLVERHSPRLHASIRRALRRAGVEPLIEDVEELAQESFCRLLVCGRVAPENGGEFRLSAYLARVGERLAFDRVRSERTAKRGFGRLRGLGEVGMDRLAAYCVDRSPSPELSLLAVEHWRETIVQWREIVGGRTPGRDVVIVSLALAGWSSEQISVACSGRLLPGTIDTLFHRAKSRLAGAGIALPSRFRGLPGTPLAIDRAGMAPL